MAKLHFKSGKVSVEYDDTIARLARAAVEKVAPGLLDEMEGALGKVRDDAARQWPVKTGRSRDGLELRTSLDIDTGVVTVEVRNDVKYAIYVRPAVLYGASTAWERFVRQPSRKVIRKLSKDLGARVLAALRRGT